MPLTFNTHQGTTPILARDSLYLQRFGYCDEDRFTAAFRDAWQSMGADDRRKLLAYWGRWWESMSEAFRKASPESKAYSGFEAVASAALHVPRIQVLNFKLSWGRETIYSTDLAGTELNYWSDLVTRLPDDLLRTYIACSLADVVVVRIRRKPKRAPHAAIGSLIRSWGHDLARYADWIRNNPDALEHPAELFEDE